MDTLIPYGGNNRLAYCPRDNPLPPAMKGGGKFGAKGGGKNPYDNYAGQGGTLSRFAVR